MKHHIGMMFATAMLVTTLTITPSGAVLASEVTTDTTTVADKKGPTDEEKKQMKEKMEKTIAKWNALTTEQKNEIYALYDKESTLMNEILDKYVALGVLEKDDAANIKAHMEERAKKMKENSSCPLEKPKRSNCKKQCN